MKEGCLGNIVFKSSTSNSVDMNLASGPGIYSTLIQSNVGITRPANKFRKEK